MCTIVVPIPECQSVNGHHSANTFGRFIVPLYCTRIYCNAVYVLWAWYPTDKIVVKSWLMSHDSNSHVTCISLVGRKLKISEHFSCCCWKGLGTSWWSFEMKSAEWHVRCPCKTRRRTILYVLCTMHRKVLLWQSDNHVTSMTQCKRKPKWQAAHMAWKK